MPTPQKPREATIVRKEEEKVEESLPTNNMVDSNADTFINLHNSIDMLLQVDAIISRVTFLVIENPGLLEDLAEMKTAFDAILNSFLLEEHNLFIRAWGK